MRLEGARPPQVSRNRMWKLPNCQISSVICIQSANNVGEQSQSHRFPTSIVQPKLAQDHSLVMEGEGKPRCTQLDALEAKAAFVLIKIVAKW